MGSGQSIPRGMPSREDYKKRTVPAQLVVNDIFLWMLNEVEINDLLALANPKHCSSYIFLTKQALSTYFNEIQLDPRLGSKDALYFESVKHLQFSDEATQKKYPQQLAFRDLMCRQLAFFYVRIFQVFGALALTVIDGLPEGSPTVGNIRAAAFAPGQVRRPPLFGTYRGGAITKITAMDKANLGDFYTFANKLFYKVDEATYIISDSSIAPGKTVNPNRDTGLVFYFPDESYNIIFRPRSATTVEARVYIENPNPQNSYTLRIDAIKVNDDPVSQTYTIPFVYKRGDYVYANKTMPIVLATLLTSSTKESERGKGLENIVGEKDAVKKPGLTTVDDTGVPVGLSYAGLQKYLKEKPKAYCVARAIQLLSPTLMDKLPKEYPLASSVCFYSALPGIPDSVPNYGQSITTHSPGMRALDQLFYDMVDGSTPKISQEVLPKYREFIQMMQIVFTPEGIKEPVDKLEKVMSRPIASCEDASMKDKQIILKNQNGIREVKKRVAELLNIQMTHTAAVMKFLQRMFLFNKQGRIIGLQPALQKGGIPAVNIIADQARTLLAEYYKQCEGTYRLGAIAAVSSPGSLMMPRPK